MLRNWTAVALLLAPVSGCLDGGAFRCAEDGQCGAGALCEEIGFCSDPDESCGSGRRYASMSGSLAGVCVPEHSDPSAGSTGGDPDDSSSPIPFGDTGALESSGEEGSTSSGVDGSSSTSGDAPLLVFIDDEADDFGAGTQQSTEFADGLRLQPGATEGVFDSQVFDAGESVRWDSLGWTPRGPYAKALPGQGLDEDNYPQGGLDMSDNVLLLHLDADSSLAPGELLADSSGSGQTVHVRGTSSTRPVSSPLLDGGLSVSASTYAEVNTAATDDFQLGASDFTWALWARSSSPCRDEGGGTSVNQVFMGMEAPAGTAGTHMWMGCFNPASDACGAVQGTGRLGGTVTASQGDGLGQLCGGPELGDGAWHHLALVKDGHADADVTLWFDGVLVESVPVSYAFPLEFDSAAPLRLGRLSDGYFANVDLDEVSVFTRALSPAELENMYLRAALRLEFQVRACETPQCEGVPFVGADGSSSGVFRDGPAGTTRELPALTGRYFQYRARLSRPSPALAREAVLDQVRVSAVAL